MRKSLIDILSKKTGTLGKRKKQNLFLRALSMIIVICIGLYSVIPISALDSGRETTTEPNNKTSYSYKSSGDGIAEEAQLAPHLTQMSIFVNGTEYTGTKMIDPAVPFQIKLRSEFDDKSLKDNLNYCYQFPSYIVVFNNGSAEEPIEIRDSENSLVGTYYIKDNEIHLTINGSYNSFVWESEINCTWQIATVEDQVINWNDSLSTNLTFKNNDVYVLKADSNGGMFESNDDASLTANYTVTVTAKKDGTYKLIDVLADSYSGDKTSAYFANEYTLTLPDSTPQTYQIAGDEPKTFQSVEFTLEKGQVATFNYSVNIGLEDRFYYDTLSGYELRVDNTAKVKSTADNDTSTVTHSVKYQAGTPCLTKTADESDASSTNDSWTVLINGDREYSMELAAIGDSLQTDGVTYIIDNNTFSYTVTDSKGEQFNFQQQIVNLTNADDDVKRMLIADVLLAGRDNSVFCSAEEYQHYYEIAQGDIQSTDEEKKTANDILTFHYGVVNYFFTALHIEITAPVTAEFLSQYVFVDNSNTEHIANTEDPANPILKAPLFAAIMPPDSYFDTYQNGTYTAPYSYELKYETTKPANGDVVSNSASIHWRNIDGSVENVPSREIEIVKSNDGILMGSDGKYYVDWTIDVTLEANRRGFDHVWLNDVLPNSTITTGTESTTYYSSIDGLEEVYSSQVHSEDFGKYAATPTTVNKLEEMSSTAYLHNLMNSVITVEYDGINPTESETEVYPLLGNYMSPYDESFEDNGAGTLLPHGFSVLITNLPDTVDRDEYTITLKYRTQINPETIQHAANSTDSRVDEGNTVYATWIKNGTFVGLGASLSQYWLQKSSDTMGIVKSITNYEEDEDKDEYTLTYQVEINPQNNILADCEGFILTDELTDYSNATYVEDSLTLKAWGIFNGATWVYDSTHSNSIDLRGFYEMHFFNNDSNENSSFNLTLLADYFKQADGKLIPMALEYKVKFTEKPEPQDAIDNMVSFSGITSGVPNLIDTAQTLYKPGSPISKQTIVDPIYNRSGMISYQVNIDREKMESHKNDSTITIVDEMSASLKLLDEMTINVERKTPGMSDWELFYDWTYTYDDVSHTLTVNINDPKKARYYRLSYSAKVTGAEGSTVSYSNTASIQGTEYSISTPPESVKISNSADSGSTTTIGIDFYKIDSTVWNKRLQGVTFVLLDVANNTQAGYFTTGRNGYARIENQLNGIELHTNTVYALQEYGAPAGYKPITDYKYFYIPGENIPTDLQASLDYLAAWNIPCPAVEADGKFVVENEPISFTLQKQDEAGNPLTGAEFKLYTDQNCTQEAESVVKITNGAECTFKYLNVYTLYYLKETKAPNGYELDDKIYGVYIDGNYKITIASLPDYSTYIANTADLGGTFPFTNKAKTLLPETGGVGTGRFVLLGLLLVCVSAGLYVNLLKNKRTTL